MSVYVLVGLCIAFAVWVGLFITLAATQHKEHNEKYDEKDKRPNDRFDHAHISPAEDCSSSEAEYKDGPKASENFERLPRAVFRAPKKSAPAPSQTARHD
jgi:hypothetical protein